MTDSIRPLSVSYSRPQSVQISSVINSYLGILSHYKSFTLCRQIFLPIANILRFGRFTNFMRKFEPFNAKLY